MSIAAGPEHDAEIEEFAGKLFMDCLAAMELANVELGVRLGLYGALAGAGPTSPPELAAAAGIHPRYAREWLEQQAAAGVLSVDDTGLAPDERRYALSDARAHVLLDDDSDACMKPCAATVPWLAKALDIMTVEFRQGAGVPFGEFDLEDIQAAFTRPVFKNHLVQSWLPAIPEVQSKLDAGEGVRVAEVGCGEGLAAIAIARAYDNVVVDGFDLDETSIEKARDHALAAGVEDRVRFMLRDAGDPELAGTYDLVLAIEMLHDVPDPVAVLRAMRSLAGAGGAAVVVDERTEAEFTVPTNEMERFFYAFSTLHCLAVGMQDGGAATGTVIRRSDVEKYAADAGFERVEVLDVEHPQFVLYRLG